MDAFFKGADRVQYRGFTGYIKEISYANRQHWHLCGYVVVPPGVEVVGGQEAYHYSVHGGITYDDFHGEEEDLQNVIGFDCGHGQDMKRDELGRYISDKDKDYVLKEIKKLIDEIIEEQTPAVKFSFTHVTGN